MPQNSKNSILNAEKTFIFIAGLPASGKDTAAKFFIDKNYFSISYSKKILKSIIENPNINLKNYLIKTIPKIKENEITSAINSIQELKNTQTGRELYITIGAIYLPKLISNLTNNKYSHFNLFATIDYDKQQNIIIAGFRMKEELETIKTKYPKSKIITILLTTKDEIRHNRIKQRDNLNKKIILENEKYERETTYKKLLENIEFNYIISNNNTEEELKNKLKKIFT